ncbi:MAG TPA: menaquinone biosynthesis protein [Bacteroidales bacterium]|nr:menaquinone biosynthesis protein [Bacteroidales bacterium]
MDKIRISAVKYANTYPFIYGLNVSGFGEKAIIETDHPSGCAEKLITGRTDLGLMPAGALPLLNEYHIVGDYCIGANGDVRTVMLLSNSEFEDTRTIYLDYRSRSSVKLIKVLAANWWKKEYEWKDTSRGFDFTGIKPGEAVVLIGDQCFELEKSFSHNVDLAGAWKKYTGLPFVFACWIANKELERDFIDDFNNALASGVRNIDAVVQKFGKTGKIRDAELKKYLSENIDYKLDNEKKKGLSLFLELIGKL